VGKNRVKFRNIVYSNTGAVFIFIRINGKWYQQQKLVANASYGRNANDYFGTSVSISGDTVVVGSSGQDYDMNGGNLITDVGAVYIFTRSGINWTQQQKLVASGTNGRVTTDFFGKKLGISGDKIVVGAYQQDYDVNGTTSVANAGAAFVFGRNGTVWTQQQKIIATGANARNSGDNFGNSLSIAGNIIVVGSPNQGWDANGANYLIYAGAIYSYRDTNPMIDISSTGNLVSSVNQSTFTISGNCNQNGQVITLSGFTGTVTNAPVTCNGTTWTAILDLSSQATGNFDITISYVISTVTYQTTKSYSKSTAGPILLSIDDGIKVTSGTMSPTTTWLAATSANGVSYYELAIGSTNSGSSDILGWTYVGNTLSATLPISTSLTSNATYYTSLRAYDFAGNVSAVITGDGWIYKGFVQNQKLVANNREATGNYGSVIAISEDGSTMVVGAPNDDTDDTGVNPVTDAGAAYVYIWNSGTSQWDFQQKLIATGLNARKASDLFGSAIAISGDTIIVGVGKHSYNLSGAGVYSQAGAAFIYVRSGSTWALQQKIIGSNCYNMDYFGNSVSISGNTVVVGAYKHQYDANYANALIGAGAAYIFTRTGVTWTEQQKLIPTGTAARNSNDNFGNSVSISGDTVVIGDVLHDYDANGLNALTDSGAAFVFTRFGSSWTQQQKLSGVDINDRFANDSFSVSVSIYDNTIAVGASSHNYDNNGDNPGSSYLGAVFVFTRNGTVWTKQQKLTASLRSLSDYFGSQVKIVGDRLATSSRFQDFDSNDANSITDAGAVYLFNRTGNTWTQQQKIVASGTNGRVTTDLFGIDFSLVGDKLVVGSTQNDYDINGANLISNAGAVYAFKDNAPFNYFDDNGTVITASNQSTYTITGRCNLNGQTITLTGFSGTVTNAPVLCNGSSWTAIVDFSSQAEGSFNVTLSYQVAGVTFQTSRPYVKYTAAPLLSSINDGVLVTGGTFSPTTTWSAATSTPGVQRYELAIGTTAGATDILAWTNVGYVLSATLPISTTLTSGSTYYTSLRAVDVVGNTSSVLTGDGWKYSGFIQSQKLAAVNREVGGNYGYAVAISDDGATMVVGAYNDDTDAAGANPISSAGAVYVYIWNNTTNQWDFQQKLIANTGATSRVSYDFFGFSVAVSGDTVVVGAYGHDYDENGANFLSMAGAAYVFTRSAGVWTQQQKLAAIGVNARVSNDNFGRSVSISGNTLVIGAEGQKYNADGANNISNAGAAYVYTRNAGVWTQQQKIVATGTNARVSSDNFGNSVSLSGDTLAIGSSCQSYDMNGDNYASCAGAAYVFTRNSNVWTQQQKIVATGTNARVSTDKFGNSLSLSGDTLVIGAFWQDYDASGGSFASNAGAAYVFTRNAGVWSQQQKLIATGPNARINGDNFGASVAVSGDNIVVGASNQSYDANGVSSAGQGGAAFLFTRSGTVWSLYQKVIQATAANSRWVSDMLGSSVAISGDRMAGGAYYHDYDINGANSLGDAGAVYAFKDGTPYVFLTTTGNIVNPSNQSTLTLSGRCNQNGQVITFSGFSGTVTNAPVICNGSTWTAILNLTSQVDGYFTLTISFTINSVTYQTQAPFLKVSATSLSLSSVSDGVGTNYSQFAPPASWNQATGSVGLLYYELSIGTSAGATNILPWTITGSSTFSYLLANPLNVPLQQGITYYTNVRAIDVLGVASASVTGVGWQYKGTVQNQKVLPPVRAANQKFGSRVALSEDGLTLAVGTPNESYDAAESNSLTDAGAVYVYIWNGSDWVFQQKVVGEGVNGRVASDLFGFDVSLSGETLVVGVPGQDSDVIGDNILAQAGAVNVYIRSGGVWSLQQKITPATGTNSRMASDAFGSKVVVVDNSLVVSAPFHDYESSGADYTSNTGAVYWFTRIGSSWTQKQIITISTLSHNATAGADDNFGSSLALTADSLAIGVPNYDYDSTGTSYVEGAGAVFLYSRILQGQPLVASWSLKSTITAPFARNPSDGFGNSVALSQDTLVVGVPNHSLDLNGLNSITNAGAVALYNKVSDQWTYLQKLSIPATYAQRFANQRFGYEVSLSGGNLAVGTYDTGFGGRVVRYLRQTDRTWSFRDELATSGVYTLIGVSHLFGSAVAISEGALVAGIPQHTQDVLETNSLTNAGAVMSYNTTQPWINISRKYESSVNAQNLSSFVVGGNCSPNGDSITLSGYTGVYVAAPSTCINNHWEAIIDLTDQLVDDFTMTAKINHSGVDYSTSTVLNKK
jgi:hypothetical protein